jgi:hypothetical protein
VPALVIYRFDRSLFFANARTFRGLTRTIDPRHFYPIIESAQAYRREPARNGVRLHEQTCWYRVMRPAAANALTCLSAPVRRSRPSRGWRPG